MKELIIWQFIITMVVLFVFFITLQITSAPAFAVFASVLSLVIGMILAKLVKSKVVMLAVNVATVAVIACLVVVCASFNIVQVSIIIAIASAFAVVYIVVISSHKANKNIMTFSCLTQFAVTFLSILPCLGVA